MRVCVHVCVHVYACVRGCVHVHACVCACAWALDACMGAYTYVSLQEALPPISKLCSYDKGRVTKLSHPNTPDLGRLRPKHPGGMPCFRWRTLATEIPSPFSGHFLYGGEIPLS